MRMFSAVLFGVFLLLTGYAGAQEGGLDKQTLKQWKKVAKDYQRNPEALLNLTNERDRLRDEKEAIQDRLNTLEAERQQMQNQVAQLQMENNQLINNLQSTQATVQQLTQERDAATRPVEMTDKGPAAMQGTYYRIQIGAFKKTRVPGNLATSDEMALEDADGMQKVMVGQFTDYEEAKQLMTYLKKMGVKGAWVVPYRDGQRITLKEALQNQ